MKRVFVLFFTLLFLSGLSACADRTNRAYLDNFTLPLEFNAAYTVGAQTGEAHFLIREEELNFGVTKGALQGLVAHIGADQAQLLYGGMSFDFPKEAILAALSDLHGALLALADADYREQNAIPEDGERIFLIPFQDQTVRVGFDWQTHRFTRFSATLAGTPITLTIL